MRAHEILEQGVKEMGDRAKTYDNPQGERSMGKTVAAFKAVTGHDITEEQGWLFMVMLKAVRSQQGNMRMDSYVDGAAYFGLAGEAAQGTRNGTGEILYGSADSTDSQVVFGKSGSVGVRMPARKQL